MGEPGAAWIVRYTREDGRTGVYLDDKGDGSQVLPLRFDTRADANAKAADLNTKFPQWRYEATESPDAD